MRAHRVKHIGRLLALGLAFALTLPATAPAAAAPVPIAAAVTADQSSEPVIMVHGWRSSGAAFEAMKQASEAAGRPAFAIDLPGQNNVTNALAIAELVAKVRAETGASKVNLVAHSMGGLSTRYYIKSLGGTETVRNYISIGSPQQGFLPGCLLVHDDLGAQMCPFNTFMKELNAGDDTPGNVSYTTIRGDEEPEALTRLDGGACFSDILGVSHGEQPRSPAIFAAISSAIDGTCPGRFVDDPAVGGDPRA